MAGALEKIAKHYCDEPARGKELDWAKTAATLELEMKSYLRKGNEDSDVAVGKKKATEFWLTRLWEIKKGY